MMDTSIQDLIDQRDIHNVIVRLFVATDQRDWTGVEECLTDDVLMDMTSLAGGEPARVTGSQIAAGWRDGLQPIDQVHHQVGNFRISINGDEADAFCYGVAYHYRNITSPDNTRTFVGSYDLHLARTSSGWRIDSFRFNL
jgi:hypothetical protein